MLEILAIVAICALMARHGRNPKRRRYNLRRVRMTPELALATLASDTAIVAVMTGVATDTYRAVSVIATWALRGITGGEGPITVGYAHSSYTVTQIKECLEAFSIDQGDKLSSEQASRLVRIVGTFASEADTMLNDGKPIKTRLNWKIAIGSQVNLFAYNEDTAALSTGAVLHVAGNMYVKDAA